MAIERGELRTPKISDLEIRREQLVGRASEGDREALGELLESYRPNLIGYFGRRTNRGDEWKAEDFASQTIENALKGFSNYRPQPNKAFSGWVLKIARNVQIDDWRKQQAHPEILPITEKLAAVLSSDNRFGENPRSPETLERVRQAAKKLPPSQREVFELYLQDRETQEIAQALGKRPGTVRALKKRAILGIRRILIVEGKTKTPVDEDQLLQVFISANGIYLSGKDLARKFLTTQNRIKFLVFCLRSKEIVIRAKPGAGYILDEKTRLQLAQ